MGNAVVRQVPAVLEPFVGSIAYHENAFAHARERVLPNGLAQLIVNMREDRLSAHEDDGTVRHVAGIGLSGVCPAPKVVDPADQAAVICVAFRPGGAYPFFAAPQSAAAGQLVGLDDLWGRAGSRLRERLLDAPTPEERLRLVERALLERAADALRPDAATAYAVAALGRGVPVASVVDRLGRTPRAFIRSFTERVGLPPKQFARIRRFQRLLASIPHDRPADWARLAACCGYYDQSHLIRDFRSLAGTTPARYRPRNAKERNHVPLPAD
ncbi:MAG: AraC family transcriptional regulator [Streptosporangiales bacterium]|nr:AraC family transcriptional regulator [Streptosporangiales bacterium]MBO0890657.1 AraC family transcriptional regulator [Acidothermales bacterium]